MPNHARAFAARPEVYAAWQQLNGAIKERMDLRRYELATLAAARRLRSSYCCLAHGSVLLEEFDEPVVEIVRDHVAGGDVKRVVVDSLAELEFAARDNDRLPGYVWALGGFVRAAGGTTIFTNEMAALGSGNDLGGLSFIFNNVFFMRYIEIESTLRRGLSVLKMRQSEHENALLEFTIGKSGLEFGEPFTGVTGMLGWSALRGVD